jgi:O-antigen ligase
MLAFNICIAGLQFLHIPWLSQQMLQPDGMLALPSFLGMVFAMTAPVIMTIHPALVIVSLIGILISKSAFTALAAGAGILFFVRGAYPNFWKKARWLLIIIPVLLVPVVKRGVSGQEMSRRLHVWPMVASKAFHNMFTGVGAGNAQETMFLEFQDEKSGGAHTYFQVDVKPENERVLKDKILEIAHKANIDTTRLENVHFKHPAGAFVLIREVIDELRGRRLGGFLWSHSHNEYLQIFLQFGLLGLILMGGYLWDMCSRYRQTMLKSRETIALMGSLIAIMILGCAHFELYMAKTGCLIIVLMALLDKKLRK